MCRQQTRVELGHGLEPVAERLQYKGLRGQFTRQAQRAHAPPPVVGGVIRRYRIDKYLDTLRANQTARKVPKVVSLIARRRTTRVVICLFLLNQSQRSSSAVIGYAQAGRRGSPMSDVSSAVA